MQNYKKNHFLKIQKKKELNQKSPVCLLLTTLHLDPYRNFFGSSITGTIFSVWQNGRFVALASVIRINCRDALPEFLCKSVLCRKSNRISFETSCRLLESADWSHLPSNMRACCHKQFGKTIVESLELAIQWLPSAQNLICCLVANVRTQS